MKKNDLRKIYKQKRVELPFNQKERLEKNIYQQVFKLDFSKIQTIHIFLSLKKFKEINTQPIINFLRNKNKQILVSKSNFTNSTLSHFILEENTKIELNKYGIPEPVNAIQVQEKNIDLVFVPLLISDKQNFRVGYGKGFYDRFLKNCKKECKTIGLNYFSPIVKIEDVNAFDISLDKVIYPKL